VRANKHYWTSGISRGVSETDRKTPVFACTVAPLRSERKRVGVRVEFTAEEIKTNGNKWAKRFADKIHKAAVTNGWAPKEASGQ
jgi:hypothetical protein